MDAWVWVLVVEYAVFGAAGIYALVDHLYRRAALNRLDLAVFTRHPVANLTPPTTLDTSAMDWVVVPTQEAGHEWSYGDPFRR